MKKLMLMGICLCSVFAAKAYAGGFGVGAGVYGNNCCCQDQCCEPCCQDQCCCQGGQYGYNAGNMGGYNMGGYGQEAGACCEQSTGECYCKYVVYEPQYYCVEQCVEEQIPCTKKCYRQVPRYFQVQKCRMVPEYYCETACKYECECYEVPDCKTCIRKVQCPMCRYIPRYYWKHECNPCNVCQPQGGPCGQPSCEPCCEPCCDQCCEPQCGCCCQ